MYKKTNALFLITQTPLHAGSGSDLGIVDLPIQRERHTGYPKIEGSSFKGSLREAFEQTAERAENKSELHQRIHRTFGFDDKGYLAKDTKKDFFGDDTDFSGSLGFTDVRTLLFPVKSMKGVFAWVTCPQVLDKFKNEMEIAGITDLPGIPNGLSTPQNCGLFIQDNKVVLEEYTFEIKNQNDENTTEFAKWISENVLADTSSFQKEKVKKDIIVLPNDDFRDFVNQSTEVITRTKIDDKTGTVAPGALWTEEYLPAETIMYSLVFASDEFTKKTDKLKADKTEAFFSEMIAKNKIMQIGGYATIGKGIVQTQYMKGGQNNG